MSSNRLINAAVFAAEKHKLQRRKGFNHIPYVNHTLKVAKLLSDFGENDEDLLIAALLHDTVEDTDTTEEEIRKEFGEIVCKLVMEVTDDKTLSYAKRKELQVLNAPHKSNNARKLKIADKICNIHDIISYPLDWSTDRKLAYLKWAKDVVKGCTGVNPELEREFYRICEEGIEVLTSEL
jgi:(p)ppGpp synthase/HD superfamily hydrolase